MCSTLFSILMDVCASLAIGDLFVRRLSIVELYAMYYSSPIRGRFTVLYTYEIQGPFWIGCADMISDGP